MATPTTISEPVPKLVAFDLDYTLWDLWVDTHVTPPLKRPGPDVINQIRDKHGYSMSFYPEVPEILLQLRHAKVHVAAASRTHAPKAARQALTELLIPGSLPQGAIHPIDTKSSSLPSPISSIQMFDTLEIYPGSKLSHFKEIHRKTKIAYDEMIFFDDEQRNSEVEKLGVTFVLVTNGVDRRLFDNGLRLWRKKRNAKGDS